MKNYVKEKVHCIFEMKMKMKIYTIKIIYKFSNNTGQSTALHIGGDMLGNFTSFFFISYKKIYIEGLFL